MTNNQICITIGTIGLLTAFFSIGLMFFGISPAWIGAAIGLALTALSTIGWDPRE